MLRRGYDSEYVADYELGRLLACLDRPNEATAQFELVLSGVSSSVLYINKFVDAPHR